MRDRIPLAWLRITREKARFLVALAGIAFACILMFVQLGFLDALFDSSTRPHHSFRADLVLVNPHFKTFFSVRSFSRERLYQALGVPGVDSITGLYVSKASWKNPVDKSSRDITVFGCDPLGNAFVLPNVEESMPNLTMLDRVLFDRGSRPEYGPIGSMLDKGEVKTEVNDKAIVTIGTFELGATFASDGNMIVSQSTFLRLFDMRSPDKIDIGLIRLQPGVDRAEVQSELQQRIGSTILVLTPEQFAQRERDYWSESTGIGFVFGLGVMVAFIVGVVIVYQILYADVSEHLSEFATMKAMGYTNGFLLATLLQEALILAVVGYIPGVVTSLAVYDLARHATMIPIYMTVHRALFVLLLTLFMCTISAAIAIRKLQQVDPAEVF